MFLLGQPVYSHLHKKYFSRQKTTLAWKRLKITSVGNPANSGICIMYSASKTHFLISLTQSRISNFKKWFEPLWCVPLSFLFFCPGPNFLFDWLLTYWSWFSSWKVGKTCIWQFHEPPFLSTCILVECRRNVFNGKFILFTVVWVWKFQIHIKKKKLLKLKSTCYRYL